MSTNGTGETAKKQAFLEAYEETCIVTSAVKKARVGRSTVYRWRNNDADFAEQWDAVEAKVADDLEEEAIKRAKNGSDVLLIFLLKGHKPERYRERVSIDDDREEARRRRDLERKSEAELDETLTGLDDNVVPMKRAS